MPGIKIAIFNHSTVVKDDEVAHAVQALQVQVSRDFLPAWGIDAALSFVPSGEIPPAGSWQLGIFDDSDQAGALGYHDLTEAGMPLGKVFAKTDLFYQLQWTVTASHELLEMLADPDINLTAMRSLRFNSEYELDWTLFYAYEVCDPCESDDQGYLIDGVLVSDFVNPAWFEAFRKTGSTQFDHRSLIQNPFELLPGGYISVFDMTSGTGWRQLYNNQAELKYSARPHVGSRRERRKTPREQWMGSRIR
jgi:hypothetical protein